MQVAQLSIAVDSKGVTDATRAMDSMEQAGRGLEGIVQKLAAAWASWKVVQYAREAATLAAHYDTLGVVMGVVGNNAGYTRAQMDAFAASLTQTGISMVESRQSLSVMAQSHIDLANATKLARLAQDAAVIGNMNSSDAFQTLIHGIQAGQTEVLRTIGINVNFDQSYKDLAQSLGKTVAQLTEQEKIQARTNLVLGKAKDLQGAYAASMETAGKQLLSMTRYAEDAQTVLGSIFSDAFSTGVQAINQGLIDMKKWLTDNAEAARNMNAMLGSAASNFVGLVKEVLGLASAMTRVDDELSIGEILAGGLALTMAVIRDVVLAAVGGVEILWGGINTAISGTLYGLTKLLGMLAGFKPPKWLENWYNSSLDRGQSGLNHLGDSAVAKLYNPGGDPEAEVKAEQAKRDQLATIERSRMAASALSKQEAEVAEWSKTYMENKKKLQDEATAHAKQYTSELAKQHEEYLKLIGDSEGAFRAQLVQQGYSGKELTNLIEQHKVNSDIEQQQKDVADWSKKYLEEKKKDEEDAANERKRSAVSDAKDAEDAYKRWSDQHRAIAQAQDNFTFSQADALTKPHDDNVSIAAQIRETNRLYMEGVGTLPEYTARMNDLNNQAHIMTQTFGDMRSTVNSWANTLNNDFVDACFGAKVAFSDLITSMAKDLAKLAMQQNVTPGLANWLGSLFTPSVTGGTTSASNAVNGSSLMSSYAVGTDYVPYDQVAQIHKGERIIPASQNAGSTASQVNNVSISVNVDGNGQATSKVTASGGAQIGQELESVVVGIIQKHQRPGGVLNPA